MADGERSAHDNGHDPPGLDAGIEVVDDPMGRAEPNTPLQHETDERGDKQHAQDESIEHQGMVAHDSVSNGFEGLQCVTAALQVERLGVHGIIRLKQNRCTEVDGTEQWQRNDMPLGHDPMQVLHGAGDPLERQDRELVPGACGSGGPGADSDR